jgi:type III restriction enzyme
VWYHAEDERSGDRTARRETYPMDGFFERPIFNPPYAYPDRHWEMDGDGQPTNQILPKRRDSKLLTPVPKLQKRRRTTNQPRFVFDTGHGLSTEEQEYNPTPIINEIRRYVEDWRNPDQWQVTPETARLLQHLRLSMR